MLRVLLLLALFYSGSSYSAWYCNEVASERSGDTINSCGIGEHQDEDLARKMALQNAYKELDLICSRSSDCANRALEITPMRTDCLKESGLYRCHRGVSATITDKKRSPDEKELWESVFIPKKIVEVDNDMPKPALVSFMTSPEGATVSVDGIELCNTPCTREINQEEHKILFELSGYDNVSKVILVSSSRESISQSLVSKFGYVSISNLPQGSSIRINNKEVSYSESFRLVPNEYVIVVRSEFHQPWHKKFSISKGENLRFEYDSKSLSAHLKISATDNHGVPLEGQILINGSLQKEMTPVLLKVPSGPLSVTIRAQVLLIGI